jgi:hypothetical protein
MICGMMETYEPPVCQKAADCKNSECLYVFSEVGRKLADEEKKFWDSPEGLKRLEEQRATMRRVKQWPTKPKSS